MIIPKRISATGTSTNTFNFDSRGVADPIYEAYMGIVELEEQSVNIIHEHVYATYIGARDGNMDVVREGFGDFIAGAVAFFRDLIKKLGEFIKNVNMYMYSMFASFEKFIVKYRTKLLEGKKNYSVMGYEYDFTRNIPNTSVMASIISDFNKDISEVTKLKLSDVVQHRDDYLSDINMDKIRGSIIGKSGPVDSSDFRQTVFELLRQGQETEKEIRVDNGVLRRYMDGYKDLKKNLDDVKRDRMKLEKVYFDIQKFFERGARHQYSGSEKKVITTKLNADMANRTMSEGERYESTDSKTNLELVNVYYQFRWRQSQEIATYSFQTFVERVNALKEATKLYEKIIRTAIFESDVKEGV